MSVLFTAEFAEPSLVSGWSWALRRSRWMDNRMDGHTGSPLSGTPARERTPWDPMTCGAWRHVAFVVASSCQPKPDTPGVPF